MVSHRNQAQAKVGNMLYVFVLFNGQLNLSSSKNSHKQEKGTTAETLKVVTNPAELECCGLRNEQMNSG